MINVFIDGGSGTTGLNIARRLVERGDVRLITLDEEHRKDPASKREAMVCADVTFLCLPDAAAVEAAALAEGLDTVVIDTSTAHRTDDLWVYGFPELSGQREKIARAKRISNPGCHASGFIALVAPLVGAGIIKKSASLSCFSLTGYSGGGKKMIAEYEDESNAKRLRAPSMYALTQSHKHLPEMAKVCALDSPPVFCPVVAPFYSGMQVTVPLTKDMIAGTVEDIKEVYSAYYREGVIRFNPDPSWDGFLSAGEFSGYDDMEVSALGNDERMTLVARFDNLGKGACGAAIQNMNIVLSLPEKSGLILKED